MNPKYPIYIISKGRWESRLTSKALEEINVPYRIVVEPKEYDNYAKVIDKSKIIVTPENFSERGQGGIPVRNFVWEHSIKEGYKRHWILDDNIRRFRRFNDDIKYLVTDGTIFNCAEIFVDRYKNVALSGFQYSSFMAYNRQKRPFTHNTRIYSCILIQNDIPFRWEGKYNEDSDLAIRVLKSRKYSTILFNAFLQDKASTMTMKGGNTDSIYNEGDNREEFARSLERKHPDVVKTIWRYRRWHHSINFNSFKDVDLIRIDEYNVGEGVNNHGMYLK
tara:strand:+ start:849 stop:1679 length:831 start_codon:yes stop_codon:yes gene_type:complete